MKSVILKTRESSCFCCWCLNSSVIWLSAVAWAEANSGHENKGKNLADFGPLQAWKKWSNWPYPSFIGQAAPTNIWNSYVAAKAASFYLVACLHSCVGNVHVCNFGEGFWGLDWRRFHNLRTSCFLVSSSPPWGRAALIASVRDLTLLSGHFSSISESLPRYFVH